MDAPVQPLLPEPVMPRTLCEELARFPQATGFDVVELLLRLTQLEAQFPDLFQCAEPAYSEVWRTTSGLWALRVDFPRDVSLHAARWHAMRLKFEMDRNSDTSWHYGRLHRSHVLEALNGELLVVYYARLARDLITRRGQRRLERCKAV